MTATSFIIYLLCTYPHPLVPAYHSPTQQGRHMSYFYHLGMKGSIIEISNDESFNLKVWIWIHTLKTSLNRVANCKRRESMKKSPK